MQGYDRLLEDMADYVMDYRIDSEDAYEAARLCLVDSMGCAIEALNFPECTKLIGPAVPEMSCVRGARVPGTRLELDPVSAAFSIGTAIRWLDMSDTFSNFESGHPSDNLGGILATADYLSRRAVARGERPLLVRDVLTALIKTYELQMVISLSNSLSQIALDYVEFAKAAATGVITRMLGGRRGDVANAISHAWADAAPLRVYRHGRNTGWRKSWAGGDATARAVQLALMAVKGEMGIPTVLTAKTHGFYDAVFHGQPFTLVQPFGHWAVGSVLFKFLPAAMESQSAAECAFQLHPAVAGRVEEIESVTIHTHKKMLGVMDKKGPLSNPADRDHCAQYIVAVSLLKGRLEPRDFEDDAAADPRIDVLREKMTIVEEPRYTKERLDPAKRSNSNAIQVRFRDGSTTPRVEVEYPAGHPSRRKEGVPALTAKFKRQMALRFPPRQRERIEALCLDRRALEGTPVHEFMELFVA